MSEFKHIENMYINIIKQTRLYIAIAAIEFETANTRLVFLSD